MYKNIIFDLNGVFLHSEYLTNRLNQEYGIPIKESLPVLKTSMDAVRKPNAKPVYTFWEELLKKYKPEITEEEFLNFWFSGESVDTELLEFVKSLRAKGVSVFILSNNFRERTTYYRANFPGLFETVDGAYFSWETGFVKPDSQAFSNIIQERNLVPEETLYFDDSEKNAEVARELGIQAKTYESIEQIRELLSAEQSSENKIG